MLWLPKKVWFSSQIFHTLHVFQDVLVKKRMFEWAAEVEIEHLGQRMECMDPEMTNHGWRKQYVNIWKNDPYFHGLVMSLVISSIGWCSCQSTFLLLAPRNETACSCQHARLIHKHTQALGFLPVFATQVGQEPGFYPLSRASNFWEWGIPSHHRLGY